MGTLYKRGRNPIWQASWTDGSGKRRVKSTRTTNKDSAKLILANWETNAALRTAGVIDPALDRFAEQAKQPIRKHVRDFQTSLESAGNSEKHINGTVDIVEQVVKELPTLSQLQPECAERHAAMLRREKRSSRTIQKHLSAVKQFSKWAYETGRLPTNPLETIKTPSPDVDRKLERRALLPCTKDRVGEWPWIRRAADEGKVRWRMEGPVRALLYELAIQTALRPKELRALTVGKLYLDQAKPYVLVPGRSTKNKKPARQYIGEELRDRLMEYVSGRKNKVFDLPHETNLARMLRADVATARKQWLETSDTPAEERLRKATFFLANENEEGEMLDFYSLRHTGGAWMADQGVNPKTIQVFMRHSTIKLTMDTYGHRFPDDSANAIGRIQPQFATLSQRSESEANELPDDTAVAMAAIQKLSRSLDQGDKGLPDELTKAMRVIHEHFPTLAETLAN